MPKGDKKSYKKPPKHPTDQGKLIQALKLEVQQQKNDLVTHTAEKRRQIVKHLQEQITFLEEGSRKIIRLNDGTQVIPIFPTDRVKTAEGLTGTVTRSSLTRIDIAFDDGKKSWRKPENLVSLHQKCSKSSGGPPKKKVAAVAQARDNDSDDSDEETYSPSLARALQDIWDHGSEGEEGRWDENEEESEDDSEDEN